MTTRAQRIARRADELNDEMESDLGPNHDRYMVDDVGAPPPFVPRAITHAVSVVPCRGSFAFLCTGCFATGKYRPTAEQAQADGDEHVARHPS